MGNVNEKLLYLADTKTAIKNAIIAKGVDVDTETTFREYATKIGLIPTPEPDGGPIVRYFDYDGTILKEEIVISGQNSTPPLTPTHDLLTFNSWNNSSINITKDTDIGAIYDTTDGKSYLFITLTTISGLSPILYLNKATDDVLTVTWGDGQIVTSSSIGNINLTNTYLVDGDYTITIECSGVYGFGFGVSTQSIFGNTNYKYIAKNIYIGANIPSINLGFTNCQSLISVTIPTSVITSGLYAFRYCYSLIFVNIPNSVTTIGDNMFFNCTSLISVSLSTSITIIYNSAFGNCHSLLFLNIPISVTTIGSTEFGHCYNLKKIYLPNSIISIGLNAFINCYSLSSASVPFIEIAMFNYCHSLDNITIFRPTTLINNFAFNYCVKLTTINIPDSTTSIGDYTFRFCYSLTSLILPLSIISIGSGTFQDCFSLTDYVFNSIIPPTLANINAFTNINGITKIHVPDESIEAYKTATNWLTYADYIYPLSTRT